MTDREDVLCAEVGDTCCLMLLPCGDCVVITGGLEDGDEIEVVVN